MKTNGRCYLIVAVLLIAMNSRLAAADDDAIQVAEKFITTFYSWDQDKLRSLLTSDGNHQAITYYQRWAEGGNYAIKIRRPCVTDQDAVSCAITVTDDFGRTLGYTATDTFMVRVSGAQISAVTFTADDPPIFEELQRWIAAERSEVFTGPCLDLFAGGTTPEACAQAVVASAIEFMASREPGQ